MYPTPSCRNLSEIVSILYIAVLFNLATALNSVRVTINTALHKEVCGFCFVFFQYRSSCVLFK